MNLRVLLEEKAHFLIFDIPKIDADYKKQENKAVRKKDLKSKEYKGFKDLLTSIGEKWEEDEIIEFLYATVDFIYWDSKRGDYNYLNTKNKEDVFFKKLTQISYLDYMEKI